MEIDRVALEEWQRHQPLAILQLDPSDRVVLRVADERDAIQKKTFTKWVNKHLKKHWTAFEVGTSNTFLEISISLLISILHFSPTTQLWERRQVSFLLFLHVQV